MATRADGARAVSGRITIEPFGDELDSDGDESVLEALLRQGRFVRHGCKHGGCGACRAWLVSGECELSARTSFSLSDADREAGVVLLCSTRVRAGRATFDVGATMDLTAEEYLAGQQTAVYRAEVAELAPLGPELRLLRLRVVDPPRLRFTAGQHVEVAVPGGQDEWRTYSLASAPAAGGVVELLVKLIPGGRMSSALTRVRTGDPLQLRGPFGQLGVRLSHRPMVMIGAGSGLAPLRSMILDLVDGGNTRPVTLYLAARSARHLVLDDELRALARAHPWFTYEPVVRRPEAEGGGWDGRTGDVLAAVVADLPDLRRHDAYVCGSPRLVDGAIAALRAAGCKERHIAFDRFVPSG